MREIDELFMSVGIELNKVQLNEIFIDMDVG